MNKTKIGIELIFLIGIMFLIPLLTADECVGGTCGTDVNLTVTIPRILIYQETADIIQASITEQWVNASYLKPVGANPFSMLGSHDFGIGAEWSNTSFNSNTFNLQCWNNNATYVNLRFTSASSPRTTTLQCWNGTAWGTMYSDSESGGWNGHFDLANVIFTYDGNHATSSHWDTSDGYTAMWRNSAGGLSGFYEEFMWWDVTPATPPNISIIYPVSANYIINLTNFNYYYYDVSPDSCWYSKNNGTTNSTSVIAGNNFTGMTSVEGSNTWRLYCNDTDNSISSSSVTFVVDKTSPTAQSGGAGGTSPSNRSYTPTSPTNFTINASDTGSGIQNITLTITNETGETINETTIDVGGALSGFFGFMYNLWYEGVYKWVFKVVDVVGNIFTTEENSLTYDITAPSGAIIYPLNTTYDHQITSMNVSFNETNIWNCWYNAGGSNVSITDTSNKEISSNKILIDAYNPPDNSITYMNDSNLTSYSFWNGTGVGLATTLNLSYKIDYDRVSNARWIFDYYPVDINVYTGYCSEGYFCYWDWNNNSWKELVYGCSPVGCYSAHFVKNISLPSNAINNFGDVKIMSPLMFGGTNSNMSIYESYITYTQTGRSCTSTNIIGLASSEGSNTWKFWVNDSVGFVNESSVTFIQDTNKPFIQINSPITKYYNTTDVLVNITATDGESGINQIWWSVDGGSNYTYTSPSIETFAETSHNITAWANDSANNINSTTTPFIVDLTPPTMELNPISNISTDTFPKNVSITYLVGDAGINTCWYNNGENLNESLTVDDSAYFGDGHATGSITPQLDKYRWAMKKFVCGDVSKLGFRTAKVNSSGEPTTNWSITIRSVETDEILLEKDMGAISNLSASPLYTYQEAEFNTTKFICEDVWLSVEMNSNTTSDKLGIYWNNDVPFRWGIWNGSVWSPNSTNIYSTYHGNYYDGNVWYSDNQWAGIPHFRLTINNKILGNGTLDCSGTSALIPITRDGTHTFTIYGMDNSNLTSSDSQSFYALFHSFIQGTTANTTTEGSVLDFTLDISMTDFHDTTAYLVYNGVDYPADSFNEVGNSIEFTKTLVIPNGAGSPAGNNVTWYWRYFVEGNSWLVDNFTTTPQSQLVYSVEIDDCSLYNDTILHFDLNDEALDTLMNISLNPLVDADVQIVSLGDESVYWQFNETWNAVTGSICIPNGLLNISSYRFNGVLSYLADTYVQEFWYIDNGLLQDNVFALDNYTNRNVTLRNLPLIDSSTFLFKYYNEKFLTQPNSIVTVLRYYIGEGVYKEVERCKLDNNGECHLHLVEEDVIYKFRISTDGTEDYLSGDYNAKCVETPCSITLQKDITTGEWDTTHDNLAEGTYHIETDKEGRNVTLSFNLNETGIMQLDVFKYSNVINSPDTLVGTESVTAKTGEISVTVPLAYGNQTYYAVVRHNTGFVSSVWVDLNEDGYKYFGALGLFLGALLVLSLGLISVSSGGWTIVFLILGLLIASITKLVNMDFYLIMFIISAGGLVIWRLASRRSL